MASLLRRVYAARALGAGAIVVGMALVACRAPTRKPVQGHVPTIEERTALCEDATVQGGPEVALLEQGRAALAEGRTREALDVLGVVQGTYPGTHAATDAWIHVGDYEFDQDNAFRALFAYREAVKDSTHPRFGYASLRLGWCFFNVGQEDRAIERMKDAVAFARTESLCVESARKTEREALTGLVRAFAAERRVDEAEAFFGALGERELLRSTLTLIAERHQERGHFDEAITIYRRLIRNEPWGAKSARFQERIVEAQLRDGQRDEAVESVLAMERLYGRDGAWARAASVDGRAREDAEERIEERLRTMATHFDREAHKTTREVAEELRGHADRLYSVYLARFSHSEHSYDMRFQYSELKWRLKEFDPAYRMCLEVVRQRPAGRHSEHCAKSAVFATEELERRGEPLRPDRVVEACDLLEVHFGAPGGSLSGICGKARAR